MIEETRLPVLAVLGPGDATADEEAAAAAVGELAARRSWVVLTGGGPGVMAAACRGAVAAGGLTIGVLPVARATAEYPNPWVRVAVFTGAGSARNAFNVLSATLCVAIGGGSGTLSEIALAVKSGVPVWCWRSWTLQPPPARRVSLPESFDDVGALLAALDSELVRVRPVAAACRV
jgi:uncharacterized protein (TIGR00725 family)